ncbi:MAG: hypothetical protein P8Z33_11245 [Gammaproteobacteria bacterium]|jgi:hypothetical protein
MELRGGIENMVSDEIPNQSNCLNTQPGRHWIAYAGIALENSAVCELGGHFDESAQLCQTLGFTFPKFDSPFFCYAFWLSQKPQFEMSVFMCGLEKARKSVVVLICHLEISSDFNHRETLLKRKPTIGFPSNRKVLIATNSLPCVADLHWQSLPGTPGVSRKRLLSFYTRSIRQGQSGLVRTFLMELPGFSGHYSSKARLPAGDRCPKEKEIEASAESMSSSRRTRTSTTPG